MITREQLDKVVKNTGPEQLVVLMWPIVEAAEDFVGKVDRGQARSVDSYSKFVNALSNIEVSM